MTRARSLVVGALLAVLCALPAYAACPTRNIGSIVPQSISSTTVGAQNSLGGATCGGGGQAPDYSFLFTAPASGTYTFDTFNSGYDTILYVRNATCTGAQLACNDDAGGTYQSQVILSLTSGQAVIIVVDGYGTAQGAFTLHVNSTVPTPTPANTPVPGFPCTCQGDADKNGFVNSSDFAAIESVCQNCGNHCCHSVPADPTTDYGDANCDGFIDEADKPAVQANFGRPCQPTPKTSTPTPSNTGTVTRTPTVTPTVTTTPTQTPSQAGTATNTPTVTSTRTSTPTSTPTRTPTITQTFSPVPSTTSTPCACPNFSFGSNPVPIQQTGTTSGSPNCNYQPQCGGTSTSPQVSFGWTPPVTDTYVIDTFGSSFDTVLDVRAATCTGTELACADDQHAGMLQEMVTVTLTAGQPYRILLSGFDGSPNNQGPFVLNIHKPYTPTPPPPTNTQAPPPNTPTALPTWTPTPTWTAVGTFTPTVPPTLTAIPTFTPTLTWTVRPSFTPPLSPTFTPTGPPVNGGAFQWSKQLGSSGIEQSFAVALDRRANCDGSGGTNCVVVGGFLGGVVNFGGACGSPAAVGTSDGYLAKYTSAGSCLWAKRYGPGSVTIRGAAVDQVTGEVVTTGVIVGTVNFGGADLVTNGGSQDIFAAKFAGANGAHVWSNRYGSTGNDIGNAIAVDSGENVIVAGSYRGQTDFGGGFNLGSGFGSDTSFILKLCPSGAVPGTTCPNGAASYAKSWSNTSGDSAYGLAVDTTESDTIVITGSLNGAINFTGGTYQQPGTIYATGATDIYIAKFHADGSYVWANHFGQTNGQARGQAIAVNPQHAVVIGGVFQYDVNFGNVTLTSSGQDGVVASYDGAAGAPRWANQITGTLFDTSLGLALTGNDVVVTGYSSSAQVTFGGLCSALTTAGNNDAFVVKYHDLNTSAQCAWARLINGTQSDQGQAVAATSTGNAVLTGQSLSPTLAYGGTSIWATNAGSYDAYILSVGP